MSNAQPALSESEERNYASLAQILGIFGFLPSLIIWLIFKDRSKFVNSQAKEALNWQITWIIVWIALWIIQWIILFIPYVWFLAFIFTLLMWAVWIVNVILSIIAFSKNRAGEEYRYFMNFRFIK